MNSELPEYLRVLAQRLREMRKQRGLTVPQTAKELGVPKTTYQNWESGRTAPALNQLPKLAAFYGITVDRLLGVNLPDQLDEIRIRLEALPMEAREAVLNMLDQMVKISKP